MHVTYRTLLPQYAGKEHELMSKLVEQYGPEPENVCHVSESDTHSIQTC